MVGSNRPRVGCFCIASLLLWLLQPATTRAQPVCGHTSSRIAGELSRSVSAADTLSARKSAIPSDATPSHRLSPKDRKQVFEKIWREIDLHYYDPHFNGVNWDEIRQRYIPLVEASDNDQDFYSLMSRMTSELHDAHTRFSSPEQWRNSQKQRGVSVGFSVENIAGRTVVSGVRPNSSAEHAGIAPGMVIVTVDGEPIEARVAEILKTMPVSSSERATQLLTYNRLLTGPPESQLKLGMERSDGTHFEAMVTRTLFSAMPEVEAHVLRSGNVYVRFDEFERPITKEFKNTLQHYREAPGLIIDLRRNGGGDLSVLLPIASYFFDKKTLFAKDATRSGKPLSEFAGLFKLPLNLYVGKPGDRIYVGPVVILVNSRSASSSEVFAAGMQDSERAKIMGSQSCGCVLGIAKPRFVKGGGVLELSEVLWFSPKGRRLEGTGILPDQTIVPTVSDLEHGRDTVLERADKALSSIAGTLRAQHSDPQ